MSLPILIDCDEVLSDFVGAILDRARRIGGIDATREQVTQWDIGQAIGWPDWTKCVNAELEFSGFCSLLDEIPGGIDWLRQVEFEFGSDRVYVCTSPWNGAWARQRAEWLIARGVPLNRQIQTSAKKLIPGHLVDDAEKNCLGRGPNQAFLIAAPWNTECGLPRGDHAAALDWLRAVAK